MDGYLIEGQMTMDILRRGRQIYMLIILLTLHSCSDTSEEDRILYYGCSTKLIGLDEYKIINKLAVDSINSWISNDLYISKMQRYSTQWKLDSLACFNSQRDKAVFAVLNQRSSTVSNSINFLYAVEIERKWYFFYGPTIYLDTDGVNAPQANFTKLHEIAMQEVFRGYLRKKDLGFWRNVFGKAEYEVNEGWFKSHFEGPGWDRNCRTAECYEKLYLAKVQNNWKHRDTTNHKP